MNTLSFLAAFKSTKGREQRELRVAIVLLVRGASVMQYAGIPYVLVCLDLTMWAKFPPLGAPEQRGGILINSSCLANIIGIWY